MKRVIIAPIPSNLDPYTRKKLAVVKVKEIELILNKKVLLKLSSIDMLKAVELLKKYKTVIKLAEKQILNISQVDIIFNKELF